MSNGETKVEERMREIEKTCAAHRNEYETVTSKIEDHEKRMRDIEKLVPALRAVMWAGAALGISVVGLIWSLITGQVQIVLMQ
jgi:hypothetical protein